MGRRLRFFQPGSCYFVTARTFQGRLLLRPDARVTDVVGGVLARAASMYGVDLFGFVVVSNHVHLLCRARDGSLSRFMQYFLGNTARKVGPLVGWEGKFWHRRYAAEPVLDDEAMEGRLRYILSHGVKEGLVSGPTEWPGLSCLPQLLGPAERTFHFFHWRKRWRSGVAAEGARDRYSERFSEEVTLTLMPLPHWAGFAHEERVRKVETMLEEIRRAYQHVKKLGLPKLLRKSPHSKPKPLKPKPQPWCHASNLEARKAAREAYRVFASAFAEASRRFHQGELSVGFPPMAFRPSLHPIPRASH